MQEVALAAVLLGHRRALAPRSRGQRWPHLPRTRCLHHGLLPRLPTYAAAGDWADWDRAIASLRRLVDETKLVARDLAWALELAGNVALEQGDRRRSKQARRLARHQYELLDDSEGTKRMVQPI